MQENRDMKSCGWMSHFLPTNTWAYLVHEEISFHFWNYSILKIFIENTSPSFPPSFPFTTHIPLYSYLIEIKKKYMVRLSTVIHQFFLCMFLWNIVRFLKLALVTCWENLSSLFHRLSLTSLGYNKSIWTFSF